MVRSGGDAGAPAANGSSTEKPQVAGAGIGGAIWSIIGKFNSLSLPALFLTKYIQVRCSFKVLDSL
jgi:hypothetical protein